VRARPSVDDDRRRSTTGAPMGDTAMTTRRQTRHGTTTTTTTMMMGDGDGAATPSVSHTINVCDARSPPQSPHSTNKTGTNNVFLEVRARQLGARRAPRALRANNAHFMRELRLMGELDAHGGCVNCVAWNDDASLLISGSDDMTVCVWSMGSKTPLRGSTFTGHTHNVFAAEFVPQSSSMKCVTTSADGGIRLIDLERGFKEPPPEHYGYRLRGRGGAHRESEASSELWNGRGAGMGMKIIFVPHEPSTFLTAHQDGRIRLFDLRQGNNNGGVGHEIVVNLNRFGPTSDIAFDPSAPTVFAACSDDPYVRVFDLRHVKSNRRELARERPPGSPSPGSSPPHSPFLRTPRASMNHDIPCVMTFSPLDVMSEDFEGISGLAYSAKGELAISCKGDDVFVIDTRRAVASYNSEAKKPWTADENHQRQPAKRYKGRQNVKTFLKGVAFMGEDQYVTTGGDDGGVYVWCKETCELVCKMQADTSVVNTVLPHPHLPQLVTCGIDNVVRIFEAGDGGVNILNPPNKDEDDMWFEADIVDSEDDEDDDDDEDNEDDDENIGFDDEYDSMDDDEEWSPSEPAPSSQRDRHEDMQEE